LINSRLAVGDEEYRCPYEFEKHIALIGSAICNSRFGDIIDVSTGGAEEAGSKTIDAFLKALEKNANY